MAKDVSEKVVFASPAWVDVARKVLEELVAEHGEDGKSFSACEVFTDAPPEIAGADGSAAWHFRIVDKTVSVGRGAIEEADMNVSADYKSVLPMVRLVYTPELVAQMQRSRPQAPAESSRGQATPPSWLVELHNRLAVVTE